MGSGSAPSPMRAKSTSGTERRGNLGGHCRLEWRWCRESSKTAPFTVSYLFPPCSVLKPSKYIVHQLLLPRSGHYLPLYIHNMHGIPTYRHTLRHSTHPSVHALHGSSDVLDSLLLLDIVALVYDAFLISHPKLYLDEVLIAEHQL